MASYLWGDNQRAVGKQIAFNVRLTFPDDGEVNCFVAGSAASGAPPTEVARLTFTVPVYAETSRPGLRPIRPPARPASARSSSGRPLASASRSGQLADTFWLSGHSGPVSYIGARAPPARFPRQQRSAGHGRPMTEALGT